MSIKHEMRVDSQMQTSSNTGTTYSCRQLANVPMSRGWARELDPSSFPPNKQSGFQAPQEDADALHSYLLRRLAYSSVSEHSNIQSTLVHPSASLCKAGTCIPLR
ncbi:uncharacterized protein BDZ83DRAFT_652657 [Colletotrichum acutatum]|uniref:Uncharacterized protein n=1 Tax=Glomerella acutata TaxID=27357 RepID=A0AAD8XDP8_GLOAC|nr:uncharacterized protein BDZ83DRAFT_652657 [Colletotrichum acutatum]KAK1723959.1 hypothetical protein BDZ83DRAFT_652657 [Colletotrichum acutatum]